MKTAVSAARHGRIPAIGLLGLVLTGCVALGEGPVPQSHLPQTPVAMLYGISAEGGHQWVKRDAAGNALVLVPLEHARDAVARAADSGTAGEYAPEALAHARTALSRAESIWQSIASAPSDQPDKIALAASKAHQAKRYAQIALGVAAREAGLQQLLETQSALRGGDAEAAGMRTQPDAPDTAAQSQPDAENGATSSKPDAGDAARSAELDAEDATTRPQPVAGAATTNPQPDAGDLPWLGRQLIPGALGNVQFAPDTAELTGKSMSTIKDLAWFLQAHSEYGLRLVAAAGDAGNLEGLALQRAQAVQEALLEIRVAGDRLAVERGSQASAKSGVVAIVVLRDKAGDS